MHTAHAVALELRKLADAFDKAPNAKIHHLYLSFDTQADKDSFLSLAKVWPRPFEKQYRNSGKDYAEPDLKHGAARLTILQSAMCRLIEPAKPAVYDCPSILSDEEEKELEEK